MTRTIRAAARATLPLLALTLGCGPSFKSVKATADLGEGLATYAHAFDNSVRYCAAFERATGKPSAKCAQVGKDAERWQRAAQALAGYSGALQKMAGQDDISVEDDLKSVLSIQLAGDALPALKADTTAGIAKAADAIAQAITREYRRSEIAGTVKSVHPHVKGLVEGIVANIKLQREALLTLHETLEQTIKDQAPDARFGSYHFEIWIEDQIAYLSAYEKAASSFLAAHERLAKQPERLSGDDAATYIDILKSVHAVYTGVDSAVTAALKK